MHRTLILFTATTLASAALAAPASRTSDLTGAGGKTIGSITVTGTPQGVILRIMATGLTPGWHGAHFHEKGDCSDAAFKNAGGHIHTTMPVVHGLLNPDANDSGDLPNIFVGADGKLEVELYSTLVRLAATDAKPALLDVDGSAVVIHASPDDYVTQPIGGAGARVACAVIR